MLWERLTSARTSTTWKFSINGSARMQTFPINNAQNSAKVGFEIEYAYTSSREVARIVREIAGVSDVQLIGSWLSDGDLRLRFRFRSDAFVVIEPFGDSSRYFIGPESERKSAENIDAVENAFKTYRPGLLRRLVGDILTLKPLTHLFQSVIRRFDGR